MFRYGSSGFGHLPASLHHTPNHQPHSVAFTEFELFPSFSILLAVDRWISFIPTRLLILFGCTRKTLFLQSIAFDSTKNILRQPDRNCPEGSPSCCAFCRKFFATRKWPRGQRRLHKGDDVDIFRAGRVLKELAPFRHHGLPGAVFQLLASLLDTRFPAGFPLGYIGPASLDSGCPAQHGIDLSIRTLATNAFNSATVFEHRFASCAVPLDRQACVVLPLVALPHLVFSVHLDCNR